jgi:hypothetical protein
MLKHFPRTGVGPGHCHGAGAYAIDVSGTIADKPVDPVIGQQFRALPQCIQLLLVATDMVQAAKQPRNSLARADGFRGSGNRHDGVYRLIDRLIEFCGPVTGPDEIAEAFEAPIDRWMAALKRKRQAQQAALQTIYSFDQLLFVPDATSRPSAEGRSFTGCQLRGHCLPIIHSLTLRDKRMHAVGSTARMTRIE